MLTGPAVLHGLHHMYHVQLLKHTHRGRERERERERERGAYTKCTQRHCEVSVMSSLLLLPFLCGKKCREKWAIKECQIYIIPEEIWQYDGLTIRGKRDELYMGINDK